MEDQEFFRSYDPQKHDAGLELIRAAMLRQIDEERHLTTWDLIELVSQWMSYAEEAAAMNHITSCTKCAAEYQKEFEISRTLDVVAAEREALQARWNALPRWKRILNRFRLWKN